jgi:hypothetical protein
MWKQGKVAPPGSLWHRDLQAAYTLFLVNGHTSEVRLERATKDGCFNALFEPAEELVGTEVDIRPALYEEADDYDYPSAENYLLTDDWKEIVQQPLQSYEEIAIAYPSQTEWRLTEFLMKQYRSIQFLAEPPAPRVMHRNLTILQKKFVEMAVAGQHQIMYLLGNAGSGKSEVLLHICKRMKGRVQIGATTGKAASYSNGSTVHGMFGISQQDFSDASIRLRARSAEITL